MCVVSLSVARGVIVRSSVARVVRSLLAALAMVPVVLLARGWGLVPQVLLGATVFVGMAVVPEGSDRRGSR